MTSLVMLRRDLFNAVRLALAKLGAGVAEGDPGDGGAGMPTFGTRVTINTGGPADEMSLTSCYQHVTNIVCHPDAPANGFDTTASLPQSGDNPSAAAL